MKGERGAALILTLIMLALLMALGGALLSAVVLEVGIAENYRSNTQAGYLAESGVNDARRVLENSGSSTSQLLAVAAGADGILSSSRDLDSLLNSTDDIPLIRGGSRTLGKPLTDTSGQLAGRYFVFLRNDSADGITSLIDSNRLVNLMSVGMIGNSRRILETTVMKWHFPPLPASLVLDGSPPTLVRNSGTDISGLDMSGGIGSRYAIGVLNGSDVALIGSGDVHDIDGVIDPRLRTPAKIERLTETVAQNSTDTWNPGWSGMTTLGNVGSAADDRIVIVNGDCELDSGSGYGLLLVRGNLKLKGAYHWTGLILVIGQGRVGWSAPGAIQISGLMFVARTRANDRGPANELGTVLASRGPVEMDLGLPGTSFRLENPGNATIDKAQQKFPFLPIAFREF